MKKSSKVSSVLLITSTIVFMFVSIALSAGTVVVIPLNSSKKLKNVITVSESGGDFTDPIDALNSIPSTGAGAPSFTNRYLIVIGPGTYSVGTRQIVMREWVDIQGSGQEATLITGANSTTSWNTSSATVVSSDNASISDVTIQNTGGSTYAIGLWIGNNSPVFEHTTFIAPSSSNSYGVVISTSFSGKYPLLTNVTANSWIGIAIYNAAKPFIRESTVEGTQWGMTLNGSTNAFQPRIVNSKIIGGVFDNHGSTQCRGNYDADLVAVNC